MNQSSLFNKVEAASRIENKKRLYFFFKLVGLVALILVRKVFPETIEQLRIPESLLDAISIYLTSNLVITFGRLVLVNFYIRKHKFSDSFRDNFILGINRITSIVNVIVLILATFKLFDISPREFFTSISIVAAAIALISKDYISNIINGMILMFSDHLSLNDQVKVGEHKGRIVDITLLNIHLLNDDDDLIYIPNTSILSGNIINYSKSQLKKITFEFELSLSKIESLHQIENKLSQAMSEFSESVQQDSMRFKVLNINKDAINMKFQLVMLQEDKKTERELRRVVNSVIVSEFNRIAT